MKMELEDINNIAESLTTAEKMVLYSILNYEVFKLKNWFKGLFLECGMYENEQTFHNLVAKGFCDVVIFKDVQADQKMKLLEEARKKMLQLVNALFEKGIKTLGDVSLCEDGCINVHLVFPAFLQNQK
jgi:hypothetical protein